MKKIIAAGIAAMLATASMIGTSNSQISTKANDSFAEVENHVALEGLSEGATTAIMGTLTNEGAEVRKKLGIQPLDVLTFESDIAVEYANGKTVGVDPTDLVYVIGIDDENFKYQVYIPRLCSWGSGTVMYLWYANAKYAQVVDDQEGYLVGDLCRDQQIDVFDLAMLKRFILRDSWDGYVEYTMCDVNSDDDVNVLDIVCLQRRILGLPDEAAE